MERKIERDGLCFTSIFARCPFTLSTLISPEEPTVTTVAFPVTSVYRRRNLDRISHLITGKNRRFRATIEREKKTENATVETHEVRIVA